MNKRTAYYVYKNDRFPDTIKRLEVVIHNEYVDSWLISFVNPPSGYRKDQFLLGKNRSNETLEDIQPLVTENEFGPICP